MGICIHTHQTTYAHLTRLRSSKALKPPYVLPPPVCEWMYAGFHYPEGMQYSVFQVNFSVYTNCTISMWSGHDWIYNWTTKSGRTQVLLNRTGWFYFVDANNCNNGMKVAVNVTKNSTSSGLSSDTSKKSENSSSPSSLVTITTIFFAQAFLFLSISFLFPSF